MDRWSRSLFVLFLLCGAFIRETRPATVSDAGGHKGAQRHLLMEEEEVHTNSSSAEIRSESQKARSVLPSSNYLQPGVFEEL